MKAPSRSASQASTANLLHMRDVQRDLLEKALHMRCVSYLADAKSNLLIETISRVGQSKRLVTAYNSDLRKSLAAVKRENEARHRAEQRLLEVTRAVDHAALMVLVLREGRVVHANETARRTLGELPVVADVFELVRVLSDDPDEPGPTDGSDLPWSREIRVRTRGEERLWARVSLSRGNGDDFVPFHVLTLEDVTAERRARRHAEGSQRLEALGQLVGGVAHDFNNILMLIHTQIELARIVPAEEREQVLEEVLATTLRGGQLTKQLLAFARQQLLTPERTDVVALAGQTIEFLQRTLGGQSPIRLEAGDVPTAFALCDPGQLQAAIVNLAINARDASRAGDAIEVDLQIVDNPKERPCGPETLPAGRFVAISVEDRGAGISSQIEERIWEPFVSSKSQEGHSGLGLSMVLGFARQSGGGVECGVGRDGEGARFTIYLPACP